MLTVSVTITWGYICSINSYCDNNREVYMQCYQVLWQEWQKRGGLYAVFTFIVTITGRSICSVSSDCDNNDNNVEVYRQC